MERNFDRVRPIDLYLRQNGPSGCTRRAVSSYSTMAPCCREAASYTSGRPYERLIEDDILNPSA